MTTAPLLNQDAPGGTTSDPLKQIIAAGEHLTQAVKTGETQGTDDAARILADLGLAPPATAPKDTGGGVVLMVLGGLALLGFVGVVLYVVRRHK